MRLGCASHDKATAFGGALRVLCAALLLKQSPGERDLRACEASGPLLVLRGSLSSCEDDDDGEHEDGDEDEGEDEDGHEDRDDDGDG